MPPPSSPNSNDLPSSIVNNTNDNTDISSTTIDSTPGLPVPLSNQYAPAYTSPPPPSLNEPSAFSAFQPSSTNDPYLSETRSNHIAPTVSQLNVESGLSTGSPVSNIPSSTSYPTSSTSYPTLSTSYPTSSSLHHLNLYLHHLLRNRLNMGGSRIPPSLASSISTRNNDRINRARLSERLRRHEERITRSFESHINNGRLSRRIQLMRNNRRQIQQSLIQQRNVTQHLNSNIFENSNEREFIDQERALLNNIQTSINFYDHNLGDDYDDNDGNYDQTESDTDASSEITSSSSSIESVDSSIALERITSPDLIDIDDIDTLTSEQNFNSYSTDSSGSSSENETLPEGVLTFNMNSPRSDFQSSERLLLSSARQNPTNRNTLIQNDSLNNNHRHYTDNNFINNNTSSLSAIPLRRQNAIRLRNYSSITNPPLPSSLRNNIRINDHEHSSNCDHNSKSNNADTDTNNFYCTKEAQDLRKKYLEVTNKLIYSLKSMKNYSVSSQIFNQHDSRHNTPSLIVIHLLKLNKITFLSFEDHLNCFLHQRKNNILWNSEWNDKLKSLLPPPPPMSKSTSKIKNSSKNEKKHSHRNHKNSLGHHKISHKRLLPSENSKSNHNNNDCSTKRHKKGKLNDFNKNKSSSSIKTEDNNGQCHEDNKEKQNHSSGKSSPEKVQYFPKDPLFYNEGDYINSSQLSTNQKYDIMNLLPCSYLKSGSTFEVHDNSVNHHKMDFNFNQVDYELRKLFGSFNILSESPYHDDKLASFIEFFGGFHQRMNMPRNKMIIRKIKFLNALNNDIKVHDEKNPSIKNRPSKPKNFSAHFEGSLIDFKNNDLRFFNNKDLSKPRSSNRSSCQYNVPKLLNTSVRFQLTQWLNLEPFNQCKLTFLYEKLTHLSKQLKSYNKVSTEKKQQIMKRFVDFKNNIPFIMKQVKSSEFEKNIREPLHHFKSANVSSLKYYGSGASFLVDWEKELADGLCSFLTCKEHCLLNIQLNYVLFTVTVDLSKVLDDYISTKIDDLPYLELKAKYKKIFGKFKKQEMKNWKQTKFNCVLLCSLNRKIGHVSIHNPLTSLTFVNKHHHSLNPHLFQESMTASHQIHGRSIRNDSANIAAELAAGFDNDYTRIIRFFEDDRRYESDDDYASNDYGDNRGPETDDDIAFNELFTGEGDDINTSTERFTPIYRGTDYDPEKLTQLLNGYTKKCHVNGSTISGGNGDYSFV